MENEKVWKWYKKAFPKEKDFAEDIDKELTFEDIYNCFKEEKEYNKKVEEIINKFDSDSDVRNRILEEIDKRYDLEENEMYNIYGNFMNDAIDKMIKEKKKNS